MRNLSTISILAFVILAAVMTSGLAPGEGQAADSGIAVTLTKRVGDGPYGTSAYSVRYATQDLAVHKNDVDLVFSGCGLLHICPMSGLKNRIAKVPGSTLADAKTLPTGAWKSQSIRPEPGAVYVMEVDDETTRMRIRMHVTSVTATEVRFEWAPFRDSAKGEGGKMGQCTGRHAGS